MYLQKLNFCRKKSKKFFFFFFMRPGINWSIYKLTANSSGVTLSMSNTTASKLLAESKLRPSRDSELLLSCKHRRKTVRQERERKTLGEKSGMIFHTPIKSTWTKNHGQLHSSCGHLISLITNVHLNYFIPFDYSAQMVKVDQNATTSLY